ncbi:MAG: DUF502 domain-containing protein [Halorientalis sp.]
MVLLTAGAGPLPRRSVLWERVRDAMITGTAVVIPALVTLVVLGFVVNFVSALLNPVVDLAEGLLGLQSVPDLAVKGVAVVAILAGILAIGLGAQRGPAGERRFESTFDQWMARIPGIGPLYTSFNEMSELLLESDTESFREVKLVEFPERGSYSVAFLTAETPENVRAATGHDEMETLFLPMAPNPVMGGYVIHVAADRVVDVDMTVEEGIRSIVTSGVAIEREDERSLSAEELAALSGDPRTGSGAPADAVGVPEAAQSRLAEYDATVAPEHARDPGDIVRRERDEPEEDTVADGSPRTPTDLESRSGDGTGKEGDDEPDAS